MKILRNVFMGALAIMLMPASAMAYDAQANTTISNTANIDWDGNGVPVNSNTATITVDELVDVSETWDDGSNVTGVLSATNKTLEFTVTNTGNGRETFSLSTSFTNSGTFSLTAAKIYVDVNNNDTNDDAEAYSTGVLGNTSSIKVWIVSTFSGSGSNGETVTTHLEATTDTTGFGSYAAGQRSAGQGEGGVNAIIGTTTASLTKADGDTTPGIYELLSATLAIIKSYSTADPYGGNYAVPGSTVTYFMTISGSGAGYATTATLVDVIPSFSRYSTNSITVNGVAQTDGTGDDYGDFTNPNVSILFGNFSSHWKRYVNFQTVIE